MTHDDSHNTAADSADCTACPLLTNRRTFLRDAAVTTAVAALAMAGVPASVAHALPAMRVAGRKLTGDTVSYPIPAQDGTQIDHDNQVILVRWQKHVYAFALSCPHQNTALRWDDADGQFQCPKHHSKYQPDGTFITGRATRNMDRFPLHRDGDKIVVDMATVLKSSDKDSAWNTAVVQLDA